MKLDPLYTLRGEHGRSGGGRGGFSSSSSKSAAVSSLSFLRPLAAEDASNWNDEAPLLLASCDNLGNAFVWNLSTRRVVAQFGHPMGTNDAPASSSSGAGRTGPGLAIRRFSASPADDDHHSASGRFLYQTRDAEGVISVHDCRCQRAAVAATTSTSSVRLPSAYEVSTYSQTFCAASTCRGDPNLFVAPWGGGGAGMATARIYDVRQSASSSVVRTLHGALGVSTTTDVAAANGGGGGYRGKDREHGMLTSLAMSAIGVGDGENGGGGDGGGGGYVVACGMESGSVFFHDLRVTGKCCSVSIGREPVLALDIFPSSASSSNPTSSPHSMVAIAGCAGDAADMSALPPSERGPAAILKATFPSNPDCAASASPTARINSRLDTCKIGEGSVGGKPGVGCCAFRCDGKLCALGGWDRRARIFETKSGRPLAILRGHGGSVTCLDWCPAPPTRGGATAGSRGDEGDGLMATGSSDGKIRIWRVYPSSPSRSSLRSS